MNVFRKSLLVSKVQLLFVIAFFVITTVSAQRSAKSRSAVLVRSSWQSINIGDAAHTPGILELFKKYLPEVEVRVWVSKIDNGVDGMLKKHYPNVQFIQSSDTEALKKAFDECQFFLHGSGPWLVCKDDLKQWISETGKPYGVMGITLPENHATPDVIELLNSSKFVYFRDTVSLALAKSKGVHAPIMEFGPDVAFGFKSRDDEKAKSFMKSNGLEKRKFLCVIPKLRKTPHWLVPGYNAPYEPEVDSLNNAMKEHDLKPYRDAIIAVVRQTQTKVLICPEDVTQVALGKEMLYDPLPEDVKKNVVWRNSFWLPDEALSVYLQSSGYFGLEQHSPIMCIGNGIPALLGRTKNQTSKGYMWVNIGLRDWFFDCDVATDMNRLTPTVLTMINHKKEVLQVTKKAKTYVDEKLKTGFIVLKKSLKNK